MPSHDDSRGFERAVALVGAGAGVKAAAVIITSGVSVATTILLVRMLGATLYGALALGLSIVALSAAVNKTGFGVAATRTIAASLAVDDHDSALDTTRGVTTLVLIGGVVGTVLVLASVVATQSQLSLSVRLGLGVGLALLLIGRDAAAASGAVARGFGRAMLMELPPLAEVISKFCIVVMLFWLGITSVSAAAGGLGASGLIATFVAAIVVTAVPRAHSARGLRPSFGSFMRLFRLVIPYAMAGVAVKLIASFDVFILGATHPGRPVGSYAPVLTLVEAAVMLAPLLLTTLFVAAATGLFTQGQAGAFAQLYVTVSKVSLLLAVPAFGVLAVSPGVVIGAIFGGDFPVDEGVVRVLLVGFFVNVIFGVNIQALIASGGGWRLARALVVPAITMAAFSIAFIPTYGPIGAAIATTISYAVLNLTMSWTLYRTTGTHPVHKAFLIVATTSPLVPAAAGIMVAEFGEGLVATVGSVLLAWIAWALSLKWMGAIRFSEVRAFVPHGRGVPDSEARESLEADD